MRALVLFAVVLNAGCLRKTEYKCTEATQCGAGGACEGNGFCSFADAECPTGRRFGDYAGSTFSNQCVGGDQPDLDGSIDPDGDGDGQTGNCPTGYAALTGAGTHQYKVIAGTAAWAAQEAACAADGANAYLIVPSDQAELTAVVTAAGATIWVGIHDEAAENTYTTSNGGTFSASDPLWDTADGQPDNMPVNGGGQADCAVALMSNSRVADEKCTGELYPAVCECEP